MKPGDLVRIIPYANREPDRYDGLVGLILREAGELGLDYGDLNAKFFWVMVNGSPRWRMPEDRLEVISETG